MSRPTIIYTCANRSHVITPSNSLGTSTQPTGPVRCWGADDFGQSTGIPELTGSISSLACGYRYTCALFGPASRVKCWGYTNDTAGCGMNNGAMSDVIDIAAGMDGCTCVVLKSGLVNCCGATCSLAGQSVDATNVTVGASHACWWNRHTNQANCWGSDGDGETDIPAGVSFAAMSAGGAHTCGITSNGDVLCWGDNFYGQSSVPGDLGGGVKAVAAGRTRTCVIVENGTIFCWGTPTTDFGNVKAKALSAGPDHACAVLTSGSVICQGLDNSTGQLTPPAGMQAAFGVSVGFAHSCAFSGEWP